MCRRSRGGEIRTCWPRRWARFMPGSKPAKGLDRGLQNVGADPARTWLSSLSQPRSWNLVMADIGKNAPEFSLKSHDGRTISLAEFRGSKWVVISAYPFAF